MARRPIIAIFGLIALLIAVAIPVIAADPSPKPVPPGQANKPAKAEKAPITLTGTVATTTDADGRARELAHGAGPGMYRLTFEMAAYFSALGQEHFFPFVSVVFQIRNPEERHHIPLLISPFGYSTYRGS